VSNAQTRISNVAHFFLSDLKTSDIAEPENLVSRDDVFNNEGGAQRIIRVAPNGKQYSYPPPQQSTDQSQKADPSDFSPTAGNQYEEEIFEQEEKADESIYFIDVFCSHLRGQAKQGLHLLARTLACQGKRVAVIRMDSDSIVVTDFSSKFDSLSRGCKIPDGRVISFGNDLDAVSEEWDYVLFSRESLNRTQGDRFLNLADSVCVVTSPEQPKLIDSYRVLKSISQDRNVSAGVFVISAGDFKQAQSVYTRIAETAQSHLGLTVDNFGYSIDDGAVVERELAKIETHGQMDVYLQRIEAWRQSVKAEPGSLETPTLFSDVLSPIPVTQEHEQEKEPEVIAEKEEFHTIPLAESPVTSRMSSADDLIILDLPEHEENLFMAQLIGQKLLFGGCPVTDQFFKFLKSTGIDCIRFINSDETGTLIMVLRKNEDIEILDWILDHFPDKDDKLMLVTEKPIGRFERTRWARQFNQIEILNMVRGRIDGRNTIIVDRH
jgi:hypothetical protein